jgi:hypothetical protein
MAILSVRIGSWEIWPRLVGVMMTETPNKTGRGAPPPGATIKKTPDEN